MEQKDWIMRQIEAVSFSFAKVLFNKERPDYEFVLPDEHVDTDLLHSQLMHLLSASKINEAENLLFESIDIFDINYLAIALDFYTKLNEYDDEYLEKCNFLRAEINSGLIEVKKLFNIEVE